MKHKQSISLRTTYGRCEGSVKGRKRKYQVPSLTHVGIMAELPVMLSSISKGEGSGGNVPEVKGAGGVFEQPTGLEAPFWE